ncbi:MAG: adenylyltransferase/cytidyltransferase family protein [Candidatus Aminicenantes bacterium]|nr:adenylyltransferase/cytidyltransferase family protein [Candidatus Aminicenantes bacterium]
MRIYRTLDSIPSPKRGCALAVGNFDGFHRGHRRIIRRLVREADAAGLPVSFLTFAPHPEKIFSPDEILMIQTLDQRLRAIQVVVPHLIDGGKPISSSRIRAALTAGNVEEVARLLGRPYEIEGEVVSGAGRGRTLGFPTANLESPNEILPPGVFATRLIRKRKTWNSVTNVGRRPTFGAAEPAVETHVLDASPLLYGSYVRLLFVGRLRDECAFRGPKALAEGIRADIAAARRLFRRFGL